MSSGRLMSRSSLAPDPRGPECATYLTLDLRSRGHDRIRPQCPRGRCTFRWRPAPTAFASRRCGHRLHRTLGPVLLPQPQRLVGGSLVSPISSVDVVEHLDEFPGDAVEVETSCPKRRPAGCGVAYPFGSSLRVGVAAVSGNDVSDRSDPGPAEALEVRPAVQ